MGQTGMAERSAFARSFQVGAYTCTVAIQAPSAGVSNFVAEWSPQTPPFLTKKEMRQFRAGRDRAIREVARLLNYSGDVLVAQTDAKRDG